VSIDRKTDDRHRAIEGWLLLACFVLILLVFALVPNLGCSQLGPADGPHPHLVVWTYMQAVRATQPDNYREFLYYVETLAAGELEELDRLALEARP
jgi:hypothetical protein